MTTPTATRATPLSTAAPAQRGRFVWHDLVTPDPVAARTFYAAVLGWEMQGWSGAMPYTMFVASGAPRGGFMLLPQGMQARGVPAHWLSYVSADDVDAVAAQAESLGGRVLVKPTDVPEAGRYAVLQDPQGAAFALYAYVSPPGDSNEAAPLGDASWHELWTTDAAAAYSFYTTLFGWESAGEFDMGEQMGPYRMFGRQGLALGGVARLTGGMAKVPPNWLPYFRVADVHATVERVMSNAGMVLSGPMEVPGGDLVASCMDPQRGAFAVHQVQG